MAKKTAFIVGAGASYEVGLPVGAGLKKSIAEALNIKFSRGYEQISGESHLYDVLKVVARQQSVNVNDLIHVCRQISEAMPLAPSIDNYIDVHTHSPLVHLCGKLAIAFQILAEEQRSKLAYPRDAGPAPFDLASVADTWYTRFFQLITENCQLASLEERLQCVTLIVFNYDRCIERYLEVAFQGLYGVDAEEASRLVRTLTIFHPYGSVGKMPSTGDPGVPYGARRSPQSLLAIAEQIKTFSEGTDPNNSDIMALRSRLLDADRVVFLGFAFHPLNVDLLLPSGQALPNTPGVRSIFGTCYGMSNSDRETIEGKLMHRFKHQVHAHGMNLRSDLKCSALFQEYSQSLSLVY